MRTLKVSKTRSLPIKCCHHCEYFGHPYNTKLVVGCCVLHGVVSSFNLCKNDFKIMDSYVSDRYSVVDSAVNLIMDKETNKSVLKVTDFDYAMFLATKLNRGEQTLAQLKRRPVPDREYLDWIAEGYDIPIDYKIWLELFTSVSLLLDKQYTEKLITKREYFKELIKLNKIEMSKKGYDGLVEIKKGILPTLKGE